MARKLTVILGYLETEIQRAAAQQVIAALEQAGLDIGYKESAELATYLLCDGHGPGFDLRASTLRQVLNLPEGPIVLPDASPLPNASPPAASLVIVPPATSPPAAPEIPTPPPIPPAPEALTSAGASAPSAGPQGAPIEGAPIEGATLATPPQVPPAARITCGGTGKVGAGECPTCKGTGLLGDRLCAPENLPPEGV